MLLIYSNNPDAANDPTVCRPLKPEPEADTGLQIMPGECRV